RVQERPLVRKIKIVGNDELKRSKVRSALVIRTPSILHPKTLQESVAAIKQLYVDEGFYAIEVTSRVEMTKGNEAVVYFDIVEGTKVTIDDIEFEGNTVFSSRKLRGFMQTSSKMNISIKVIFVSASSSPSSRCQMIAKRSTC
ncbi:MAG: hypothetical protein JRG71_10620, partial [Deltaproteobacteria bacterium]|nr:hypothetical protein [Deltaproteobacteria bacterium]